MSVRRQQQFSESLGLVGGVIGEQIGRLVAYRRHAAGEADNGAEKNDKVSRRGWSPSLHRSSIAVRVIGEPVFRLRKPL